jgi:hypothetical protein
MLQEEDSQQNLEPAKEQIFTPETFSIEWDSEPSDLLDIIPLDFPYSSREWDEIFEHFTDLLDHPERWVRNRTIARLIHALEMETSQRSDSTDYQPKPTEERFQSILEAIALQSLKHPHLFEALCSECKYLAKEPPYTHLILEWLEQLAALEEHPTLTPSDILAAQLLLGAYNTSWQQVGATLLKLLDHADLTVRAGAANQIGKFCSIAFSSKDENRKWRYDQEKYDREQRSVIGIPPLDTLMQLIYNKELERPGVAGAFWNVIPKNEFNAKEWLLNILENSPAPEPRIPYFPCDLAFDAHERFSRDANSIRRLMNMGRAGTALAAATDEDRKIADFEPLLVELGYHNEPEIIRIAAWYLAYYYHYLHPRGAELGYVEAITELTEIDLFLLFSRSKQLYAVVIYSKNIDQQLSLENAQKWVDQIFPSHLRGNLSHDSPPGMYHCYQRGYVKYHASDKSAESNGIDCVIIGYRSKLPWNPKDFL